MIMISEILGSFIRIILCLFFLTKEKANLKTLLISALGAIVSYIALSFSNISLSYLSVFEIIVIMLFLYLSHNTDRRKNLFICIMYEIGIYIWTFILAESITILTDMGNFSDRNTLQGQLPLWIVNIILFTAAVFIYKGKEITIKMISFASVLSIFGVVILSEEVDDSKDTTLTYLILSVILLSGIMVYRLSKQYETEKELSELKEKQAELLERDYNLLNKAYSENARTFHDMHNHIGAVRSLLTAEKYDKAIEYLDNLQKPINSIATTVWTGEETVDYLINSRIANAENEGISFETSIEFPKGMKISSADLCAVLGNLLDNAFDAVRKDKTAENRSIKLIIRRINRMLIIKVVNTFSGQLNISEGKLKTTKNDNGLHGWGIESAKTAAKKYDGTITTTAENGIFTAVATLSF